MKSWECDLFGRMAALLLVAGAITGCAGGAAAPCGFGALREYEAYNDSPRMIFPKEYIDYLRTKRFTNGELDHLPDCAIIVHVADIEKTLTAAGYQASEWTTLATGTTDPTVLYVVRPKAGPSFIADRGLPGAGGIATQAAELGALGVRKVVHIGTSCFLGENMADSNLVVSVGSFKDGGAVLLSDRNGRHVPPIAKPAPGLVGAIELVLKQRSISFQESLGYTIPVFYFQPSGLIHALLDTYQCVNDTRPAYLEMEEAPFFQTCNLMHVQAASIVIGSDRYVLSNGKPKHEWLGDTAVATTQAFKSAIEAMQLTP